MIDPLVLETLDNYDEAKGHLHNMVDAVIMMSGSPSFSEGGDGHSGWVGTARPALFAAMKFLDENRG